MNKLLVWDLTKAYLFSKKSFGSLRRLIMISLAGSALGVGGLVLIIFVMKGFNQSIHDRLLVYEPHLVSQYPAHDNNIQLKYPNQQDEKTFLKTHGVLETRRYEKQDFIIRSQTGKYQGVVAEGFSTSTIEQIFRGARFFGSQKPKNIKKNEVFSHIGLGFFEGDLIEAIAPEELLTALGEIPKSYKLINIGSLESQNNDDTQIKKIYYKSEGHHLSATQNRSLKVGKQWVLEDPWKAVELKNILQKLNPKVQFETWEERNSSLLVALKFEKVAMTLFLALSALLTGFSIISVLLLLMAQKRRDMGILMSMGLSQRKIRILFGQMGFLLSWMGSALGLVTGLVLAVVLKLFPLKIMTDEYQDPYLPIGFDFYQLLGVLLFCLLLSLICFWVPMRRLSKLTPIAALKT